MVRLARVFLPVPPGVIEALEGRGRPEPQNGPAKFYGLVLRLPVAFPTTQIPRRESDTDVRGQGKVPRTLSNRAAQISDRSHRLSQHGARVASRIGNSGLKESPFCIKKWARGSDSWRVA